MSPSEALPAGKRGRSRRQHDAIECHGFLDVPVCLRGLAEREFPKSELTAYHRTVALEKGILRPALTIPHLLLLHPLDALSDTLPTRAPPQGAAPAAGKPLSRRPQARESHFRSVVIGLIVLVKASQETIDDEVSHFAT